MKIVTLKKVLLISALLGILLILVILLSITMGSVKVKPLRSISILFQSLLGLKSEGTETEKTIILSLRFPRALLAGLVGAGLSVSGAIFQALLRNPLADPYILGVSSGAAVGAIIAILMGLSTLSFGLPVCLLHWSLPDHPRCFLFREAGWKDSSEYPTPGRSHHQFLSLGPHHVFHLHLPEGGTPYDCLLVDGRLQLFQLSSDRHDLPLYLICLPPSLPPRSPVQPDPFRRRECVAIGSGCGEIKVDLLPLCFFDHRCIRLGVWSDRFRRADCPSFGSIGLRT